MTTSPAPEERVISPDDEDWDWRAGSKILADLSDRCRFLASRYGKQLHGEGYYCFEVFIEDVRIWVGEESRVKVEVDVYGPNRHCIYASHAQVEVRWKMIQTKILPLLKRHMVLDDLSEV